jgi:hypothetical protein
MWKTNKKTLSKPRYKCVKRVAYHVLERSAENEGKAQEEGAQRDEVSVVATKQCLAKTSRIGATHERRREKRRRRRARTV